MKKFKFSLGIFALIGVILATTVEVITIYEMQLFAISCKDILLTIIMPIILIFCCGISAFSFYECGKDNADEEKPPS